MSRYESGDAPELSAHQRAMPPRLRATQRRLIVLFGAVSLLLSVGGYWYYHHEAHLIRSEKHRDLHAVAGLKVNQIVQWRHEREADARVHSTEYFFRAAVGRWSRGSGDASLRTGIQKDMESIHKFTDYENVVLAGTDGAILLSLDPRLTVLEAGAKQLVAQAVSSRGVVFGDFFHCPSCNQVQLDVAAPILDAEDRPAAVLILRTEPEQYLYPLIQSWPAPSETAETLLIRKDGEDVLFLNQLRHRPDAALTLRIPLSSADVPAVRAALGETGQVEGHDYRGVEVVADIRPVPGSPWFMVAKVDAGEILAEARYRGQVALLFVVLSILMTGGTAAFVFNSRQRSLYRSLYRAERERREAQEEIRTTLHSIGDAVIATDTASHVARMNPVAEQLTGWREAEALGKPLDQVFPIINEETRATVESPIARVLREGTVVGLANHTVLIARDGTERPIADSGSPIRNEEGQVTGVVLVFRDQTEQRQAERAIQEASGRLEQALARAEDLAVHAEAANAAKGRFLASVSHDLRTPMNAILGMVDLALKRQVEPTARDFLQTAKESADLLLALLNDLLDCAKIESGKLELETAPFSLRRVLDQTTRALAVRASEKGIGFSWRISSDVPDALVGDQVRLRGILFNLAGNAIKFTERGEVAVSVRVESQDPGEACLEFAVRDTGIGIQSSDLERIFRPFGQADASTSRRFGGTGLGLTIASSLVAMMGGRLWVESEPGKGSTFSFTVRLPIATEPPPEPQPSFDLLAPAASPLRILVVEDNPANQKLAAYVLHERGHAVDVAADGRQALSMTGQNQYDVILMDVQMPGMDGLETTAAIRAQEGGRRPAPIIAMTAHAVKGDRERCLAAGMDGYLSKPIVARDMVAAIEGFAAGASAAGVQADPLPPAPAGPAGLSSARVFDPELALKRCCNNQEVFGDIVQYFLDDVEKLFPQMRSALQQGDLAEVGRLGHRLKGTLVYLGAEQAREAALRVERLEQDGGQQPDAQEAVGALEQACEVLKTTLAAYRAAACRPEDQ